MQISGPRSGDLDSGGLGRGPQISISNKFPGQVDAAGSGPTPGDPARNTRGRASHVFTRAPVLTPPLRVKVTQMRGHTTAWNTCGPAGGQRLDAYFFSAPDMFIFFLTEENSSSKAPRARQAEASEAWSCKEFNSLPISDERKLRESPPGLVGSNARQVRCL